MTSPDRRNIKINVTVDSDTRGSEKAAESLEHVDKSAGKAEHGLSGLRKESESLENQIGRTQVRVRELEKELVRTGDASTARGSVRSQLRRERSFLQELERIAKATVETTSASTAEISNAASASFGRFTLSNPNLIKSLVAAAAVAAPTIGAIVAGAVAGTTVGGGIAGGIIAASNDARVRSAFKDFLGDFTAEAFGAGAFVEPVLKGIDILRQAFRGLNLDDVLSLGASSVPILAQGIADLAENFLPGFIEVLQQAEPFTKVFAEGLAETGAALGDFLKSIVHSEGTIEGLATGFKFLSGSIIFLGNALEILGDIFHATVVGGAAVTGALEDIVRVAEDAAVVITKVLTFGLVDLSRNSDIHNLSNNFGFLNDELERVKGVGYGAAGAAAAVAKVLRESPTKETVDYADAVKALNDEFERTVNMQDALLTDQIDFNKALQDIADTAAEVGPSLDITTEAGQRNAEALQKAAREARAVRQDNLDLKMPLEDANALFEAQKEAIYRQGEAAGFSREKIEELIGALLRIPSVRMMGTAVTFGESNSTFGGGLQEFADGGWVKGTPGSAQLIKAHAGEYVMTADQARYAMGGGGGGTVELVVRSGGSAMDDLLVQIISKSVQGRGGDGAVLGITTVRG